MLLIQVAGFADLVLSVVHSLSTRERRTRLNVRTEGTKNESNNLAASATPATPEPLRIS
jgi:hypothetical protein